MHANNDLAGNMPASVPLHPHPCWPGLSAFVAMLAGQDGMGSCKPWQGPGKSIVVCKRNCVDMAAIIVLAPLGRPAVAEEVAWLRVGAAADILDVRDAGVAQPRRDESREIEQGVARARRGLE